MTSPKPMRAAIGGGRGSGDRDLVAVLQEGPHGPVGQGERFGAAPAQLQQAAALLAVRAADRARGVEVPGPGRGAVHGQVGQHLGGRPVHGGERRPGDHLAVQLDLQREVEAPVVAAGQVGQRFGVLRRRADPGVRQRLERHDPGRDRGGERLGQERAERPGLPGLDVAGRPVVDQERAEHVVGERVDPDRASPAAIRRRSRSRPRPRSPAAATGRTPGRTPPDAARAGG